ncbi:SDR family oxidoreductase [Microbacterium sp. GXF7504]
MQDVRDEVVVITGGTSGIGLGIALAFARAGAKVAVLGRGAAHLEEARERFAGAGLPLLALQADVTDREALERVADRIEAELGPISVLVNNAGIGLTGPVAAATPADWDWVVDVNIKGVGNGLLAFLPRIRAHGRGGHIVNTASMAGLMPVVAGLYSMTKAGVIALSEALAIELAPEGIGVSAYCPGPTHSNIATAVANRPSQYGESGYAPPDPAFAEAAARQPYMSAEEAGERVLEGVRRNDLFILTHPEFAAGVAERHATIEQAFPDEPIDETRKAAIPFLLGSPVYAAENRRPAPRRPSDARV